jgi:hypothetical protein
VLADTVPLAFSPALQNAGLLGLTKWRPRLCDERPGPPTSGWPWGLDPEAHVDSLRERQFLQLCHDSLFKPCTYIAEWAITFTLSPPRPGIIGD